MPRTSDTELPHCDFGLRSGDYARQRPGPPDSLYDRLDALRPLRGARVLDVGTGPGVVALELAARGARVLGTDVSDNQLAAARALAHERGLTGSCSFEREPAEASSQPDASFELITACQCWHWFDHARALAECTRLLAPGGLLAIIHYCYLPQHSSLVRDSEALIHKYNPGWKLGGFNGLLPWLVDGVITDRMRLCEQFCCDHDRELTHEAWRGRMRTCNGVGSGGMNDAQVAAYDHDLADLLAQRYPEPLLVPHRIHCVVAAKRP